MIRKIERADGVRWQVYGRRAGKQVYVGTFDSKKEAQEKDEDHRTTQRKVKRGELPEQHDTRKTLKDAIDEWLAWLKKGGARSHRAYSEFVKYQIEPNLGTAMIASLTKRHIAKWRDDLEYAPTTVNAALGCLSSAFTWFVDERGWLPANPCAGVAQAEVPDRAYNWIKTRGELERLLLACSDELRDMVAVSVGTAIRIDEMLHLQWDDVDLENRLICVQRGRQGTPKGGRIRHVPILDSVLSVLKKRALRRGGSVLVFPGRKGAVRAKTPVQVAFKQALHRAQLDTTIRYHDLRHTAASWWVLSGGDIFRLSKLMGHRSVKVTQDTYAHLAPEAWTQDYARIAFHVPSEPAKIYEIRRDENGKLAGRTAITIDARAAG
jgi:integrase/recombinase XerD